MIEVSKGLILPEVLVIRRKISLDHRGINFDVWDKREYVDAGINVDWVQVNGSRSRRGVIRGLHGDDHTYKLVCCARGSFWLTVVNYVQNSPDFGKWERFILTEDNGLQVLVPPNYLNGHLALSRKTIFLYLQSSHYTGAENQWSVRWNDPRFNIPWPVTSPILSERDGGRKL